jgi:hypothetical protein
MNHEKNIKVNKKMLRIVPFSLYCRRKDARKKFIDMPEQNQPSPVFSTRDYLSAQKQCEKIASELGQPKFYIEKAADVSLSQEMFLTEPLVAKCLSIIQSRGDCLGHGLNHVRKVAVDAGAIVLIETEKISNQRAQPRIILLSHLAGLLHDIRRQEKGHAQLGAETAAAILATDFHLVEKEGDFIVQAIRNHEAFQPFSNLQEPEAQLLSDSLYDADKFRWGPDNFTETIWAMAAPRQIPLQILLAHFLAGMDGIRRIRGTFRTNTGKIYGPDFIDLGLEIGLRLYEMLKNSAHREMES